MIIVCMALALLAAICSIRWMVWRINCTALMWWVVERGLEPETKELNACRDKACRQMVQDFWKGVRK